MYYIGIVVAVLIKSLPKLVKFMDPEYLCTEPIRHRSRITLRLYILYILTAIL